MQYIFAETFFQGWFHVSGVIQWRGEREAGGTIFKEIRSKMPWMDEGKEPTATLCQEQRGCPVLGVLILISCRSPNMEQSWMLMSAPCPLIEETHMCAA